MPYYRRYIGGISGSALVKTVPVSLFSLYLALSSSLSLSLFSLEKETIHSSLLSFFPHKEHTYPRIYLYTYLRAQLSLSLAFPLTSPPTHSSPNLFLPQLISSPTYLFSNSPLLQLIPPPTHSSSNLSRLQLTFPSTHLFFNSPKTYLRYWDH